MFGFTWIEFICLVFVAILVVGGIIGAIAVIIEIVKDHINDARNMIDNAPGGKNNVR